MKRPIWAQQIAERMEAKRWDQGTLCCVLGRPLSFVSNLMSGRTGMTIRTAKELAAALGESAQWWLNLRDQEALSKVRISEEEKAAIRLRAANISELRKSRPKTWQQRALAAEKELVEYRALFQKARQAACRMPQRLQGRL